jgi:broad specificity phosphatase PhoE
MKNIHFDRFYSSDAGRQRETMAVILTQKGITDYHLNELPGLREVFLAVLKGRVIKKWPMLLRTSSAWQMVVNYSML